APALPAPPEKPVLPPPPPAPAPGEEDRPGIGLAAARQRVDPFREAARPTATDYEAALAEAKRVLGLAPLREDARFLAVYAQGGLDYLAHSDEAARRALTDTLAATKRMPFAREGRLLSGLLRRAEDSGGLTPWEVALAYGDSRGDAEPLLAAQLSNHPND